MAYPATIEALGGRERAIATARAMMKEMDELGGALRWMKVGAVSQMVSEAGTMYAVLPTTAELTIQGRTVPATSYLLGVSTDGGRTWRFADGVALMHPETQRRILPSLPASLTLPAVGFPGWTP
jgi:hypothetical protein